MKTCPECNEEMKSEHFNEGTHYFCICGHNEFWHVGGAESDPQVWFARPRVTQENRR